MVVPPTTLGVFLSPGSAATWLAGALGLSWYSGGFAPLVIDFDVRIVYRFVRCWAAL